ncbi:MAG: fibronectin type III domain-containing protein [Holophagaceae bacterium]|nr:fibronectin type III domain-containing protein [Holophagaceae bacterium]
MRPISCLAILMTLLLGGCGGGGGSASPTSAAPTRLVVTESGRDQITLNWVAPTTPFDGYELEGRLGTEPFEKVHTGLIPNTYQGIILSFQATAPDNTTYAFRLRVARGSSFSTYSNEASYARGPNTPGQPTGTYDWGQNGVSLTWTRNTISSDGLQVERAECTVLSTQTGPWVSLPVPDPLASTYLDQSADANHYYLYRLTNLYGTKAGQPSTVSSAISTWLEAPYSLNAFYDNGYGGILLSWASASAQVDGRLVERSDCALDSSPLGNWSQVALLPGTAVSFLDSAIGDGRYYAYRITNRHGPVASAPTQPPSLAWVPLFAPVNLQVVPSTGGLQLTWQNRTTGATQVIVRRSPGVGGPTELAVLPPGTTSYLDVGPELGYYLYWVTAKNLQTESASESVFIGTPNPPGALALTATPLNLPGAASAALRPLGSWVLAGDVPFGIQSYNDPWPAITPAGAIRPTRPIVQVDRLGWPHAVYASPLAGTTDHFALTHLWFDGTGWQSEPTVTAKLPSGGATSAWTFQLDALGTPHLLVDHASAAYPTGGATEGLSYVHKEGGTWVEEPLAGRVPAIPSLGSFHLRLDGADVPHLLLGAGTSVLDCVRTGPGTWASATVPTGPVTAGWYDFLDGTWIDGANGWIFHESLLNGDTAVRGLWATELRGGAWQAPVLLGSQVNVWPGTRAKVAISPDRTRLAVLHGATLGIRVYHLAADGWHPTLLPSDAGSWPLFEVAFDGAQKVHVLLSHPYGYTDFHE